ncbi:TPA: hypothetical protein N0F65_006026 [Lagenidium giganteum]|uniref:Uncharacterized protein n=1 Tax=Lagenidium giganteum TaxID=4803 RepID=A0AAV2Z9F4_9STRA|nr:TPA: hypothetical protein N0F65_006026 [Lagenidium giganteum]
MVMLDTKNLSMAQITANTELKKAKLGYMINENVAKLILRNLKRLHSSFNVDLLSHFVESPDRFDSRPISKAIPVVLTDEGEELQLVEKLLKKRQFNRMPEWFVKWHGLP